MKQLQHVDTLEQEIFQSYLGSLLEESIKHTALQTLQESSAAKPVTDPLPEIAENSAVPEGTSLRSLEPFQALFCQAGAWALALPVKALGAITNFPENLRNREFSASGKIGAFMYRNRFIPIFDLGTKVAVAGVSKTVGHKPKQFVVLSPDYTYGFAVEAVHGIQWVNPHEVSWGKEASDSSWCLGIIKEKLTAVIGLDNLATLLS